MRKRTLCLVALCLAAGSMVGETVSLHGQGTVLDLDATLTKVEFTLGDVLHTVHGSFKLKSGSIHFDPATGQASGELVVDAGSGATGSEARDNRMRTKILESERFPEITFKPDRFEGHLTAEGESAIDLHGMFGIHGVEHEITLKTTVHLTGNQLSATTHFAVP